MTFEFKPLIGDFVKAHKRLTKPQIVDAAKAELGLDLDAKDKEKRLLTLVFDAMKADDIRRRAGLAQPPAVLRPSSDDASANTSNTQGALPGNQDTQPQAKASAEASGVRGGSAAPALYIRRRPDDGFLLGSLDGRRWGPLHHIPEADRIGNSMLRVRSVPVRFYRAGLLFTRVPRDFRTGELTTEQLNRLLEETELVCQLVEPGEG